jgi:hypothetical protein
MRNQGIRRSGYSAANLATSSLLARRPAFPMQALATPALSSISITSAWLIARVMSTSQSFSASEVRPSVALASLNSSRLIPICAAQPGAICWA